MGLRAAIIVAAFAGATACADSVIGADDAIGAHSADGADEFRKTAAPPPLGACIDSPGAMRFAESAHLEGQVEEVGLGLPDPGGEVCPLSGTVRFGYPGLGDVASIAQTSWVRVRDAANQSVVLSAMAEGFAFPLAPGDSVQAQIDVRSISFNLQQNTFEARAGDGSLLFWVASGARLADLDPPKEVALSMGDVEEEIEFCEGAYRVRTLNVEADGLQVSVPNGARVDVGPWTVVNALTYEQTVGPTCPDAYFDRISIAVWTRDARVRDTGGIGGPCYANLPIEQADKAPQWLCLPDGTLTLECSSSHPCPGESVCEDGLCRLPG
jgi:hypothetical protein